MRASLLIAVVFSAMVIAAVAIFAHSSSGEDAGRPTPSPALQATFTSTPTLLPTPSPNLSTPGEHAFGFIIPDSVSTLDEAIDYVRQVGQSRYAGEIYKDPNIEVTTGVGGIPEMVISKIMVIIKEDSADEAQQMKVVWGDELRQLFARWDLCDIDIAWELSVWNADGSSTEIVTPHHNDPNLDESFISPGCDKSPVEERYPYAQ